MEVSVSLAVTFNEATQRRIQPGDTAMVAEDGHKFVLVRMDVTNVGEETRELTVQQYMVQSRDRLGDNQHDVHEFEEHFLAGRTVRPDETATGWVAFQVVKDVTEGVLTAIQEHPIVDFDITFTRDTSLDVSFPD